MIAWLADSWVSIDKPSEVCPVPMHSTRTLKVHQRRHERQPSDREGSEDSLAECSFADAEDLAFSCSEDLGSQWLPGVFGQARPRPPRGNRSLSSNILTRSLRHLFPGGRLGPGLWLSARDPGLYTCTRKKPWCTEVAPLWSQVRGHACRLHWAGSLRAMVTQGPFFGVPGCGPTCRVHPKDQGRPFSLSPRADPELFCIVSVYVQRIAVYFSLPGTRQIFT